MAAAPTPVLLLAGGPGTRGGAYRSVLRELLRLPGRARPRVAYVGAATDDDPGFAALMERLLASAGDCAFRLAPVVGRGAKGGAARAIIEDADLVFLGGGDVELGMRRLEERALAGILARKHAAGAPFLGVSAGAILLARRWVRWRDPEDDATAERFECLGLAPILCDCHGERDGWAELRALLRLEGDGAVGHGLRAGAALRVAADGSTEPAGGTVDRLVVRRGEVLAR